MKLAKNDFYSIIMLGCAWGIVEATIGFFLHLSPLKIGYLFWFPCAFWFMRRIYKKTQKMSAVIGTALLAASIKLIDLFTAIRPDYVINPAISIVLESIALCMAFLIVNRIKIKYQNSLLAFSSNTAWRLLYMVYCFMMPQWMFAISPAHALVPALRFLIYENILTSAIIFLYLTYEYKLISLLKHFDWFNSKKELCQNYICTHKFAKTISVIAMLALSIAIKIIY